MLHYLVMGTVVFGLAYAALFTAFDSASAATGVLIGAVHALVVGGMAMPMMPAIHPRMGAAGGDGPVVSEEQGQLTLSAPGFFGVRWGGMTPVGIIVGHVVYGLIAALIYAARQAIHLTVAAVNDCGYCQAAYTGAARAAGFEVDETIQIRLGRLDDDPRLNALLTLVRQIADNRGYVDDSVWSGALDAGWTTEELLDAYAETIRTILTNCFNHLVGTDLDLPPAPDTREG